MEQGGRETGPGTEGQARHDSSGWSLPLLLSPSSLPANAFHRNVDMDGVFEKQKSEIISPEYLAV